MILLSVLGVIGIVYIIIVQMAADSVFTYQYYNRVLFKEKAYYISRSAYTGVQDLFLMDNPEVDSLLDIWAQETLAFDLEDEQVVVHAVIEDQDRYLNPNKIMQNDDPNKDQEAVFRRLFRYMQMEPDLLNALMDWIDRDSERRFPMGADGLDYQDYPSKGAPLDSVEEIRLIKGLSEFYAPRKYMGNDILGLKDVLSVYASGRVNINTAPFEVLLSLDDEMSPDLVSEIIRIREITPFQNVDELIDVAGANHDLVYRLKRLAGVNSTNFKLTVYVENYDGSISSSLEAVFTRGTRGGKILFWQAN